MVVRLTCCDNFVTSVTHERRNEARGVTLQCNTKTNKLLRTFALMKSSVKYFHKVMALFSKTRQADEAFYAVEWFLPVVPIFRTASLFFNAWDCLVLLFLCFSSESFKKKKKRCFAKFFYSQRTFDENRKTDYSFFYVESVESNEELSVWHVVGGGKRQLSNNYFSDIALKIVPCNTWHFLLPQHVASFWIMFKYTQQCCLQCWEIVTRNITMQPL